jgi:hypothetical protein
MASSFTGRIQRGCTEPISGYVVNKVFTVDTNGFEMCENSAIKQFQYIYYVRSVFI